MKLKLFGKDLFAKKKSRTLYDFAQHNHEDYGDYLRVVDVVEVGGITSDGSKKKKTAPKPKPVMTPKGVYNLGTLNQPGMLIKNGKTYIAAEQVKLRKKLALIKGNSGSAKYGRLECESMVERLGNRLRLAEFKNMLEDYPHTTTTAITDVVKAHPNLRFGEASGFIADMPDEAVEIMDSYRKMCQKLCGKDPVFYVLADKKDFGEVNRRRDPILFAQSPFGFFWQILGAWDEEMIYLGDL